MCLNIGNKPSALVVFDTNVYRDLAANRSRDEALTLLESIKNAEKSKAYIPQFSITVARELISHFIDDENTKGYKECTLGAELQYRHCQNEQGQIWILPTPEEQLSHCFYSVQNKEAIEWQYAIMEIGNDLLRGTYKEVIANYTDTISGIVKFLEMVEEDLLRYIQEFLLAWNPNYKGDWNAFKDKGIKKEYFTYLKKEKEDIFHEIADTRLKEIRDDLSRQYIKYVYSPKLLHKNLDIYVNSFRSSLEMEYQMLEKLPNGIHMDKEAKRNIVWDEQILMVLPNTSKGIPFKLVTSDKGMLSAAKASGLQDKICTRQEYMKDLGL